MSEVAPVVVKFQPVLGVLVAGEQIRAAESDVLA